MDLGIRGRRAIVAGASAGLGKSSALALAREGVEVLISARNEERLKLAAADIGSKAGAAVSYVVADHSTREGRAALLAACPEPDILVITCSPPKYVPDFRDITEADWHESIATGMVGPIELMKASIDGMASRKWGRIVNITTMAARFPVDFRLLSGPSRSALTNFTSAVARAVAKDNVILNNIMPGMFHTRGIQERLVGTGRDAAEAYEEETQRVVRRLGIATGGFGDPDDLGAFCAMLCSEFAGYMVGQSLLMDGGRKKPFFDARQ